MPSYQCRAWVNFNGTGTVAIRGSGNVSSITDNGTGLYTVNFTTAMPDANYSVVTGGSRDLPPTLYVYAANVHTLTTSSFQSKHVNSGTTATDWELVCFTVFSN